MISPSITGAGFIGCSSAGNKFFADKPYESDGPEWENGDVLTLVLDFNNLQLNISRNGTMMTFDIPVGSTLYPWINLYQAGSHVSLLGGVKVKGTVFFDDILYHDMNQVKTLQFSRDGRVVTHIGVRLRVLYV